MVYVLWKINGLRHNSSRSTYEGRWGFVENFHSTMEVFHILVQKTGSWFGYGCWAMGVPAAAPRGGSWATGALFACS